MLDAEPALKVARRVPVKHPAALDSDGRKAGHSRRATPFPRAAAATNRSSRYIPGRREPRMKQGKTGGVAVKKSEQRLEAPLGSEAVAAAPKGAGGRGMAISGIE
jgi:hypothetical protein